MCPVSENEQLPFITPDIISDINGVLEDGVGSYDGTVGGIDDAREEYEALVQEEDDRNNSFTGATGT
jgi:hypothetical protein